MFGTENNKYTNAKAPDKLGANDKNNIISISKTTFLDSAARKLRR